MVYTILISIVFIAELIIAITIFQNLIRLDKLVLTLDETITAIKPSVSDVCALSRKISEQWIILAEDFVEQTKRKTENILLKQLSKILTGFLLLNLNFKIIKKIRKSRITKTIVKGWSFLESMV